MSCRELRKRCACGCACHIERRPAPPGRDTRICRGDARQRPSLAQVDIRRREGQKACVAFTGQTPIVKVELNYTTDTGAWQARNWQTVAALLDTAAGRATGILPKEATAYFFNLTDQRGLVVSSEHVRVVPQAAAGGKNRRPSPARSRCQVAANEVRHVHSLMRRGPCGGKSIAEHQSRWSRRVHSLSSRYSPRRN